MRFHSLCISKRKSPDAARFAGWRPNRLKRWTRCHCFDIDHSEGAAHEYSAVRFHIGFMECVAVVAADTHAQLASEPAWTIAGASGIGV